MYFAIAIFMITFITVIRHKKCTNKSNASDTLYTFFLDSCVRLLVSVSAAVALLALSLVSTSPRKVPPCSPVSQLGVSACCLAPSRWCVGVFLELFNWNSQRTINSQATPPVHWKLLRGPLTSSGNRGLRFVETLLNIQRLAGTKWAFSYSEPFAMPKKYEILYWYTYRGHKSSKKLLFYCVLIPERRSAAAWQCENRFSSGLRAHQSSEHLIPPKYFKRWALSARYFPELLHWWCVHALMLENEEKTKEVEIASSHSRIPNPHLIPQP